MPFEFQLVGHSDSDVLLHAVTDAILGAAASGDIGEMFPNTDEANRNRDSAVMLKLAMDAVTERGFQLVNLDCIVFAQKPKLTPYKLAIRERIAEILEIDLSEVSVKAKTGESVGPVGRGEAMMAECIALLNKS